jgi:hypothetical protein
MDLRDVKKHKPSLERKVEPGTERGAANVYHDLSLG